MRLERGFTLLELMIAMTIFALLAVAGWQVFDGVTRAREKAQYHADNLAALQYAYLQLQQDMAQMVAYQAPPDANSSNSNTANSNSNNDVNNSANNNFNESMSDNKDNPAPMIEPFMRLTGEQISFVRFADPDPRYQISPSLQRVDYIFADQRLIRRQYSTLPSSNSQNMANNLDNANSVSLDTILLEGISAGRWQAYLPELSSKYPNAERQSSAANNLTTTNSMDNNKQGAAIISDIELLPKGVGVSFSYEDIPITWQWALAPQALPQNSKKTVRQPSNSNANNSLNSDNSNNDTSNNLNNE